MAIVNTLYIILSLLMVLIFSVGTYAVIKWHMTPFDSNPAPRRYLFTEDNLLRHKLKLKGCEFKEFKEWHNNLKSNFKNNDNNY